MFKNFMTLGHIRNVPSGTTLNTELRHPEHAMAIRLDADRRRQLSSKFTGLQAREIPLTEDANVVRDRLNAEFKDLMPTLLPKTRYRGVDGLSEDAYAKVLALKKGDIVEDAGFAYFSKHKKVAQSFSNGVKPVFIECKIPFWSKVSRMLTAVASFTPNGFMQIKEGETLLPAGSKFKVLQNKLDKKGVVRLVLKYLK